MTRMLERLQQELSRVKEALERLETAPQGFRPLLTTPLTSTSFDGDSFSDTSKTLIDMESEFGAPPNVRAFLLYVGCRDSGSASNECYVVLGPTNTAGQGMYADPTGQTNDRWERECLIVPADGNGDIYYQIEASGAGTFDLVIEVLGYWL